MRFVVVFLAFFISSLPFAGHAHALEITQAQTMSAAQPWSPITLPDHWTDTHPNGSGERWYRVTVTIAQPNELLGVYLKRACNNAWIYANGELIYSGGGDWSGPRVSRLCHFPVLASWPKSAQRAGRNELLIRLYSESAATIASEQRVGHLSAVVVGSWQRLLPVHEQEQRVRIALPRITAALMGFAGLTLLLLWWRYRRDGLYAHFGVTLTAGALGTARVFITTPGIDNAWMERLIPCVVVVLCVSFAGCLLVFNSLRSRLYPRLWWGAGLFCIAAMWLVPALLVHSAAMLAYALSALVVCVTAVQLTLNLHQRPPQARLVFFVISGLILFTGLHDYLVQMRVLTYSNRPLIQVVFPLLLLGFMMRLLARHAEALATAESARSEMELRVQIVTREIESSFEQSLTLQKERATQDERERIARDLHDDLGARLLTLVHRSHDEKASESAREALSDLRLLIGHLNQPEGLLNDAISDWRAEISERCDAANRQLQWQADSRPKQRLGTRQKITLGRLLREGITNILKHTDSPSVAVAIHISATDLHISITDNAASASVSQWRAGNGLRNLTLRATQIGAQLSWQDVHNDAAQKTGTCLRCTLPLSALDRPESGAAS